jgi:hypothetical protein
VSEKTKRFLLFTGDDYYPCGGTGDFKGSFDTLLEVSEYLATPKDNGRDFDWYNVLDTETGAIIEDD